MLFADCIGADFAVGVVRVGVNTKDGTKGQGTSHCLLGVLVVVVVFGVTCAVGVVVAVAIFLCLCRPYLRQIAALVVVVAAVVVVALVVVVGCVVCMVLLGGGVE